MSSRTALWTGAHGQSFLLGVAIDHLTPNGSRSWPSRSAQNISETGSTTSAPASAARFSQASTSSTWSMKAQVDDVDAWWKRGGSRSRGGALPVSEMFWGDRYGQLRDPFGVKWSIATPSRKD